MKYKNARELENERRLQLWNEQQDLAAVLAIPEGERYISRLMTRCGVFGSVFDTHGSQMARKEGKREVGLAIMHEVAAVRPDILADMLNQAGETLKVSEPKDNDSDDAAD